jgi:hypothetical protein
LVVKRFFEFGLAGRKPPRLPSCAIEAAPAISRYRAQLFAHRKSLLLDPLEYYEDAYGNGDSPLYYHVLLVAAL